MRKPESKGLLLNLNLILENSNIIRENFQEEIKKLPLDFNHTRANILKWMVRLAERCRMSDLSWFKGVTLFDRVAHHVFDPIDINSYFKIAAVCLYICSKNFDDKYLYANMLIEGIKLTKLGQERNHMLAIDIDSILKYESCILRRINFSLSYF